MDIPKTYAHLAELGFSEESLQEYQIRAARNQHRGKRRARRGNKSNPAACIPQPLWGQFSDEFRRAWEAEKNEDLKAALLLHSSKLKNKELPAPGQARSQPTYAVNFETTQNDDSDDGSEDGYINYNICSVNQYGEPYISGYDADDYDDNDPESVLLANTATNSSTKRSKKKQPKPILLPKPK